MNLGSGPLEGDAFGEMLLARQEGRAGDMIARPTWASDAYRPLFQQQ
mgnify:CR=1 FL=1